MNVLQYLNDIDQSLFKWINHNIHFYFLDYIMIILSSTEFWISIASILLLFSMYKKNYEYVFILLVVLVVVAMLDPFSHFILKPYFERWRPCKNSWMQARYILGCGGWYSFPSNHAVNSAATAAVVYFFKGYEKTKVLLLLSFLVGFSRVYLGVHYPFDILAGFIFGFSMAYIFSSLVKKIVVGYFPHLSSKINLK